MFNQSIFVVLVSLSLGAIFTSAAPKTTFNRQLQPRCDDCSHNKPKNYYKYETYDNVINEDESPQIVLLDDDSGKWELARQVADGDYVSKAIYRRQAQSSYEDSIDTDIEEDQEPEIVLVDSLFSNDEKSKTHEQLEQERLRDIEAQIIPKYNDETDSDQLERDKKPNFIADDEKFGEQSWWRLVEVIS